MLLSLIGDIIDLSKISSGVFRLETTEWKVGELVQEMNELF